MTQPKKYFSNRKKGIIAFLATAILLSAFIFTLNAKPVLAIEASTPIIPVVLVENNSLLCHDGIDNDGNFLVDASDPGCSLFLDIMAPLPVENTTLLCHDGIDNNGNFLVDASDPDCSIFFPTATSTTATSTPATVENTSLLCHDGIDNNGNFLVDASDPDCTQFFLIATSTTATSSDATSTPPVTASTPDTTPTGGSQTGGSSPQGGGGGGGSLPTGGSVLGAFTSDAGGSTSGSTCTPYLSSYMRYGWANNTLDVTKLQTFLNTELGTILPTTGFFGLQTKTAVEQLQAKYTTLIMQPWVDAGLTNTTSPTGFVYMTTLWYINNHAGECAGQVPFPTLKLYSK